jgi:hypothetical protein
LPPHSPLLSHNKIVIPNEVRNLTPLLMIRNLQLVIGKGFYICTIDISTRWII